MAIMVALTECYPRGVAWGSLRGTRLADFGAVEYQKCSAKSLALAWRGSHRS
jgi:hypothetical protein